VRTLIERHSLKHFRDKGPGCGTAGGGGARRPTLWTLWCRWPRRSHPDCRALQLTAVALASVLTWGFRRVHIPDDGLPTVVDVDVLDANVLMPTMT